MANHKSHHRKQKKNHPWKNPDVSGFAKAKSVEFVKCIFAINAVNRFPTKFKVA